nr:hypothetical protein [Tanacetum cinerariifolium]
VIGGRLCGGCVVVEGGGDGWVAEKGEAGGGLCGGCVHGRTLAEIEEGPASQDFEALPIFA